MIKIVIMMVTVIIAIVLQQEEAMTKVEMIIVMMTYPLCQVRLRLELIKNTNEQSIECSVVIVFVVMAVNTFYLHA